VFRAKEGQKRTDGKMRGCFKAFFAKISQEYGRYYTVSNQRSNPSAQKWLYLCGL
jgi:hypothetical protein